MQIFFIAFSIFVSLVAGAAISIAAPFESLEQRTAEMGLERRTVGGIYLCADINYTGRCGYAVQPLNQCINLGTDWNDLISSFGPDPGTTCRLYINSGCNESTYTVISYPGSGDLRNQGINDLISSFICYGS